LAFGFATALGLAAGFAAAFGATEATGAATLAAGTSAAFATVELCVVLPLLGGVLQQHLHKQRLSNQPNSVPAKNHQKQHPKLLKSELIFTPQ
jgi:Na+/glutamate symporter